MALVVGCSCGAKVRVAEDHLGKTLRCPACRSEFVATADAKRLDLAPAAPADATCPTCQTAIAPGEVTLTCPECKQVHHRECWAEVGGCSTYGCKQAPALTKPAESEGPVLSHWGDTKTCPMCGEKIKAIALRCRYCGTDFDTVDPLTAKDLNKRARKKEQLKGFQTGVIFLFIASLPGCLAPITLIINLAWFLPRRKDAARGGPFYLVLGYASLVISVLYTLLIAGFLVWPKK